MEKNELSLWEVIIFSVSIVSIVALYQIQTTNRKFIDKGYTKCALKGMDYAVWTTPETCK